MAASSKEDPTLTTEQSRRRLTLAACSFSLFMVTLDGTIVNVALPSIQRQLGASLSGLLWIVDAYTLVLASLLLTAGAVGDRIGRKRVFQAGLVIFAAGSLLCSLAPSLGALVSFRVLQAVGGAMLLPTTLSIIANTFPEPAERARAIGIWGGVSGLSIASGPVLGGLLVDSVGWRSIFWVNIPVAVVALVVAQRFITESRAPRPRSIDLPGQALAVVFLGTLTYGLIEGPTAGWSSARIVAFFAVAAVSLVAFVLTERRSREPLLELSFFRSPPFSGAASIAFLAFIAFVGFIFFNTLYLQEVRGYSAILTGVASLPATGAIVFTSPISGRMTGRWGPRLPIVLAASLVTVGMVMLAQTTPAIALAFLVVAYLFIGVGLGLINPPITNAAIAGMPQEQAGVASGVTGAARQVGVVFGVALLGSVVTSRFHSLLPARLGALHLRPAVQSHVLAVAHSSTAVPTGSGSDVIGHAVGAAFSEALRSGYWLAAVAAGLAVVVGLATMGLRRGGRRARGARGALQERPEPRLGAELEAVLEEPAAR
jgi:EmrB/QacA subfamily drug resistance transporter